MTHCTDFTVCVLPIHLLRQHQGLPNNSTVTGGGDHSESFYISGCVEFKRLFYQDLWFFGKKLLLLWGLLNKDLIALNACVQGKWKHAKLCNSSTLDIWQRTIVGYNSWLVPIWGLNQKTEFGSQIYRMYGSFMLCNQDGKGSVFILQKEDYLYIFQILQIRQHWLHWQHNYLCFSYILHFVCLSVCHCGDRQIDGTMDEFRSGVCVLSSVTLDDSGYYPTTMVLLYTFYAWWG